MLMAMRPVEVIAMLRDLNLTSHAFSVNAQELQSRISRYAEIGNSQPFNPDVGDPFVMELSRLLANTLASAKSLISGQRTRRAGNLWPPHWIQVSCRRPSRSRPVAAACPWHCVAARR